MRPKSPLISCADQKWWICWSPKGAFRQYRWIACDQRRTGRSYWAMKGRRRQLEEKNNDQLTKNRNALKSVQTWGGKVYASHPRGQFNDKFSGGKRLRPAVGEFTQWTSLIPKIKNQHKSFGLNAGFALSALEGRKDQTMQVTAIN